MDAHATNEVSRCRYGPTYSHSLDPKRRQSSRPSEKRRVRPIAAIRHGGRFVGDLRVGVPGT